MHRSDAAAGPDDGEVVVVGVQDAVFSVVGERVGNVFDDDAALPFAPDELQRAVHNAFEAGSVETMSFIVAFFVVQEITPSNTFISSKLGSN